MRSALEDGDANFSIVLALEEQGSGPPLVGSREFKLKHTLVLVDIQNLDAHLLAFESISIGADAILKRIQLLHRHALRLKRLTSRDYPEMSARRRPRPRGQRAQARQLGRAVEVRRAEQQWHGGQQRTAPEQARRAVSRQRELAADRDG